MGYEKLPRIRDIAKRLINKYHPYLKDAKRVVEYCTRDDSGIDWAGKCKKCASFERFLTYAVGRYAWVLEDIKALDKPIPAKGALNLWEWKAPYIQWASLGGQVFNIDVANNTAVWDTANPLGKGLDLR